MAKKIVFAKRLLKIDNLDYNLSTISREIHAINELNIGGRSVSFFTTIGCLLWQGKEKEGTYLLEVSHSVKDIERDAIIQGRIPLYLSYARTAHTLAERFCKEHKFNIIRYVTAWPKYQGLIKKANEIFLEDNL